MSVAIAASGAVSLSSGVAHETLLVCIVSSASASSVWLAVLVVALALVCIAGVVVRRGSGGDWSVTQGNSTDEASDGKLFIGVWLSCHSRRVGNTNEWQQSCAHNSGDVLVSTCSGSGGSSGETIV
ncbi:hypothetical protein PR002_g26491 [Phytophthora rubi]|uniref:Uncharacterized protein n=1 Tax=Phytophthora rubi TaxID=129364 RepID=A0A6A3HW97_9STRA|nr:hypothetical protein PR002_g26491 [Phytophthora rubi]